MCMPHDGLNLRGRPTSLPEKTEEMRTLRPPPDGVEMQTAKAAREAENEQDGGLAEIDQYGEIVRVAIKRQNRIPKGDQRIALIQEAMNANTVSVHKSDPASERAKVPILVRPKLELESTRAQEELFKQEWALYCIAHWTEAVKMSELKQCMAPELKTALGPAGMSETFDDCAKQLASIRTFLLGHTNPVQDVLDYLKTHHELNKQVMTFMKRLTVEGNNCNFRIHRDDVTMKDGEPGWYYFNYYMIKLKIMEGLQDPFIKQKVITLYQKVPRATLDTLFKKVVAWETAKNPAEISGGNSLANGANGGGPRPKREGKKSEFCMNCGEKSHPGGNTEAIRKTKCKAYGKTCGRCKQQHHFTNTCKVTPERLPEVLARNGGKYQPPPGKEGKTPFKKNKGRNVNAAEADPPKNEPTATESKLTEQVASLQARLDRLIPDPSTACVSAWIPAQGLERDPHANAAIVTLPEEEHQPPLTYAAAAKRALEPVEGQQSHTIQRTPTGQTL